VYYFLQKQRFRFTGSNLQNNKRNGRRRTSSVGKSRKLDITEDVYYEIIRQKTATLIAACCEVGVRSNNVDEETALKMKDLVLIPEWLSRLKMIYSII
jgi:geranylgeranyl pyrophosphate synthase